MSSYTRLSLLLLQAFTLYPRRVSSFTAHNLAPLSAKVIGNQARSKFPRERGLTHIRSRRFMALFDSTKNEDERLNNDEFQQTQAEIDAMMRQQDESSSNLLGMNMAASDASDDKDLAYNAVPMFTGAIVLLVSVFFTGYGFFVFFTGYDPIFLNQPPTAPPPDSWYDQFNR